MDFETDSAEYEWPYPLDANPYREVGQCSDDVGPGEEKSRGASILDETVMPRNLMSSTHPEISFR